MASSGGVVKLQTPEEFFVIGSVPPVGDVRDASQSPVSVTVATLNLFVPVSQATE